MIAPGTAQGVRGAARAATQTNLRVDLWQRSRQLVYDAMGVVVALVMLFPIYWMVATAFKPGRDILSLTPKWIPAPFTLQNFQDAIARPFFIDDVKNSVVVVGVMLVLALAIAFLAAVGTARFGFRGRTAFLVMIIGVQMVPLNALIIPLYLMLDRLGQTDALVGVIGVYLAVVLPFMILSLQSVLENIDPSLEEAASNLGARPLTIFRRVILRGAANRVGRTFLSPMNYREGGRVVDHLLATARAKNEIFDLYNKIEDARAEGKPLAEAAANLKLEARTVEIDRSGRDPAGTSVKLPDAQRLLAGAFTTDVGVERDPLQFEDGYIWYDVAGISPSRERSLDEAKDQVEARWREQEIATRLDAKATGMLDKLKAGETLAQVAAADHVKVESLGGLKRGEASGPLSAAGVVAAAITLTWRRTRSARCYATSIRRPRRPNAPFKRSTAACPRTFSPNTSPGSSATSASRSTKAR